MATATPTASAATPRVPPPAARSSQDRQGQLALGGAWNVGFPVASVHHFTNAVSGLGFEFMLRSFVLPQVSLGASADFQSFVATKPRATYQLDNGALTATAYNTVQTVALRGTLHFYALKNGPVLPYAGVTFGLGWSTFQSAAAGLAFYDNQASVLLGADAGALFPITDSSLALLFAVRYLALPVSEFLSVDSVQSVSLQFGLLTL
ncbi:MAG TPA: hypothetical protein VFK05_33795 [Polyangiaceae bacterium]|nr:hypothetical protein [Polyangiaceae bacterium]